MLYKIFCAIFLLFRLGECDKSYVVYHSDHKIVDILTPLNDINFPDKESYGVANNNLDFFFIEADVNDKGAKDYKGLYIYKNGTTTKLLDDGVDMAISKRTVYFATKHGIYVYNKAQNKAEKYGTIDDSIISIARRDSHDDFIVLTEDHVLYRVTKAGTTKEKISNVHGAQRILSDWDDNVFYYGLDKQPYVLLVDGVRKIEGLPPNPQTVHFVRPRVLFKGVLFLTEKKVYQLLSDGTSELLPNQGPAAYPVASPEIVYIQRIAEDNDIIEYSLIDDLQKYPQLIQWQKDFLMSRQYV